MKPVVRAFIFNAHGEILMTHHQKDTPWVLPGGHVEDGEALHDAMIRELKEEFGISARFFDIDSSESLMHQGKKLTMNPLPITSYDLEYVGNNGKNKSRTEYIFLMETDDIIIDIQTEEILEYQWIDPDEILSMKRGKETWDFYIQILERILNTEDDH